jgi:hypothetical protein
MENSTAIFIQKAKDLQKMNIALHKVTFLYFFTVFQ